MSKFDNLVLPDETTIGTETVVPIHKEKPAVGTFETISNVFKRTNYTYTVPKYISDMLEVKNNIDDSTPDGWEWFTPENVQGIPENFWWQLESESPKELEIKKRRVQEQLDLDEKIGRGGAVGRYGGMFISGAADPLNFIPIYGQLRLGKMGTSFVKNAVRAAPQVAFSAGLSELALNATQETMDARDWVWNTMSAAVIGGATVGAIKSLRDAHVTKSQMATLRVLNQEIDPKAKYNEKGEFEGYVGSAIEGSNLSAAAVDDFYGKVANGIDILGENTFFKTAAKFSPNVRGLTGHFGTTRTFTNSVFNSSFLTGKIKDGLIDMPSAESKFLTLMAGIDNLVVDAKKMWAASLGFEGNTGLMRAHFDKTLTWEQVSEQVCENLIDDVLEGTDVVKDITNMIKKQHFDNMRTLLVNREMLRPDTKPRTANGYLTNMPDQNKIAADEEGFNKLQSEWLEERDMFNKEQLVPLNIKRGEITALRERKAPVKDINKAVQEYKKIKEDLQARINNGEFEDYYLSGRPQLDAKQFQELKGLREPLNKLQEELKSLKGKKGAKEESKAKQKEIDAFYEKLEHDAKSKKIDIDLTFMSKKGLRLINPDKEPWFAKAIKAEDRPELVKAFTSRILQENEEQMYARMFNDYEGGGINPLKARTWMIPQNRLKDWTVRDIERIMKVTGGYLSRKIGMHDAMAPFGKDIQKGRMDLTHRLHDEYITQKEHINNTIPKSPERTKLLKELKKTLKKEEEFIRDANKIFYGNYVDKNSTQTRVLKAQRDLAASTMRGAVAFTQIGEVFAPILQDGIWRYVEDGLLPALKSMTKDKRITRADFADMNLGNNTALSFMMDSAHGDGIYYQPKTGAEKVLNYAAKQSGNIFLTNQMTDVTQTISASIAEAGLMRMIFKRLGGKNLTKVEKDRLALMRFPEHLFERAKTQFDRFGEKVDKSFKTNLKNWDDPEIALAFRTAINKEVRRAISQPSMLDVPFSSRKPVVASITQFMGWSYGATANYLFPLLQRPDAKKVSTMVMLLAGGALVGPLRQLAAGDEVDLEPETLFREAFFNSGVLGIYGDGLARLNAAFNLKQTPHRYKGKSLLEIAAGPLGGTLNTAGLLINGMFHGYTENDARKMIRMVPWMNAFYLRQLNKKLVDFVDLPRKRKQATGLLDVAEDSLDFLGVNQ